jgi:hypothetical protein
MLAGGVGCLLEILLGRYDSCCISFDLEIRLESGSLLRYFFCWCSSNTAQCVEYFVNSPRVCTRIGVSLEISAVRNSRLWIVKSSSLVVFRFNNIIDNTHQGKNTGNR